ncbi:unnamed protein product [Polarella glacialis]|uniref:Uncharacterized protein n=1 Tax=Polarella glacialis TaxID=89957 RepID=A0A813HI90_POLGL|nr:unnamed protein product [Polarella glacialis]
MGTPGRDQPISSQEFVVVGDDQQLQQAVKYHHKDIVKATHVYKSSLKHIFGHQRFGLRAAVPFVTLSTAAAGSSRSDDESGSAVASTTVTAAGCRDCSSATGSSSEASSTQAAAPAQAPGEPPLRGRQGAAHEGMEKQPT